MAGRRRKAWRFLGRGSGRKGRVPVLALLAAAVFAGTFLIVNARLRPLVGQLAVSRASYLATRAINDAVSETISGSALQYDDLVLFEKDIDGRITALKTNMLKINRLKSGISNRVIEKISGMEPSRLSVPLGNILEGELFAGRGPRIPVRIVPVGTVNTELLNSFSEAGINQTRHEIILKVSVSIGVLMPGSTSETAASSQITIAETIIVGTVPGTVASFDGQGGFWGS